MIACWRATITRRTAAGAARHLGSSGRIGDVDVIDRDPFTIVDGNELDLMSFGQRCESRRVIRRHVFTHRQPCNRPVHGAGIQVCRTDAPCQSARHGALAGAGRTIDGHHH
jgi:hypothetical protein